MIPEYVMYKALNQWLSARVSYKTLKEWGEKEERRYEKIHGYVANMGGFYLDFTKLLTDDKVKIERLVTEVENSGDNNTRTRIDHINLSRSKCDRWVLNFCQLKPAKEYKLFDFLPDVSAQDLERSSSSIHWSRF